MVQIIKSILLVSRIVAVICWYFFVFRRRNIEQQKGAHVVGRRDIPVPSNFTGKANNKANASP